MGVGLSVTVGVAVGKGVGVVVGVGGNMGVDVGVGVDEVHDTNTGTTAIARKANKVLRSTTIAKTLPCMARLSGVYRYSYCGVPNTWDKARLHTNLVLGSAPTRLLHPPTRSS